MANAKDLRPNLATLRILIYGESGTGKTVGAATFPKPYFFDFDNGMISVAGKDVEYDTYRDYPPRKVSAWRDAMKKLDELERNPIYETIVIDSITTLGEALMNEIQKVNNTIGRSPTLHEWGMQVDKMVEFMNKLTAPHMKANIIVTAHEQVIQDEKTGEIRVLPLVTGKKLPDRLAIFFDELYHAFVDTDPKTRDIVYRIHTRPKGRFRAKTRLQSLEPVEIFEYKNLMAKWMKRFDGDVAPDVPMEETIKVSRRR